MPTDSAPVLVTGATGKQGGATARALLAAGVPVRALVRDPATERAKAVEALGAHLVTGDFNDRDSVIGAAEGARAVFSVQMPAMTEHSVDHDGELAQAVNLIEGALAAGVPQFVQTTVSGVAQHTEAPGWSEGRWAPMETYYQTKSGIEDRVRDAGFAHWTIIRPATFMENFLPDTAYLMPRGVAGGLVTVIRPETRISLVAVDDIGVAAAAVIAGICTEKTARAPRAAAITESRSLRSPVTRSAPSASTALARSVAGSRTRARTGVPAASRARAVAPP